MTGENYKDIDGNPISLERLILQEPEWAASRIRAGQREGVSKRFAYLAEQLAARDKHIETLMLERDNANVRIAELEAENAKLQTAEVESCTRREEEAKRPWSPVATDEAQGEPMTRDEQLDAMTEEDKQADLLAQLERCDFIRLERREQLAFWGAAVDALVSKGLVTTKLIEVEEQYSYVQVRKAKP